MMSVVIWLIAKSSFLSEPQELEAILRGGDLHALRGLYDNRSLFVALLVNQRALRPEKSPVGHSISGHRLHELGTGKWYDRYTSTLFYTELDKVLNRKRGIFSLRKMIFNRAEYLWEKSHPTDIFTDLRHKISERLSELDKNYDLRGGALSKADAEEVEKTLPPGDAWELFGEEGREGNFLEDKIDFIGRKLLSFEEQVSVYGRAFIILVSIWLGWKLLVWLLS